MAKQCTHCGATIRSRGARFCEFCGTEVPRRAPQDAATPQSTRRAQFDALRAHPDHDRWLNPAPAAPSAVSVAERKERDARWLPWGVLFVAVAACASFWLAGPSGDERLILMVPMALAFCLGVVLFSKLLPRSTRPAPAVHAPRERRHAAIVVDERSEVGRRGADSHATTEYFLTLEFEDGVRREYPIDAKLAGRLTPGDAGIAVVLQRDLLAYHRLDI